MLSYYLKCRKNTESKNPKVVKTKKEKQSFHQIARCVIVKNQDSSNSKNLVDYEVA